MMFRIHVHIKQNAALSRYYSQKIRVYYFDLLVVWIPAGIAICYQGLTFVANLIHIDLL